MLPEPWPTGSASRITFFERLSSSGRTSTHLLRHRCRNRRYTQNAKLSKRKHSMMAMQHQAHKLLRTMVREKPPELSDSSNPIPPRPFSYTRSTFSLHILTFLSLMIRRYTAEAYDATVATSSFIQAKSATASPFRVLTQYNSCNSALFAFPCFSIRRYDYFPVFLLRRVLNYGIGGL
jgi:hypothetical protein